VVVGVRREFKDILEELDMKDTLEEPVFKDILAHGVPRVFKGMMGMKATVVAQDILAAQEWKDILEELGLKVLKAAREYREFRGV